MMTMTQMLGQMMWMPASLLARYYKVPVERIVVVYDDIDLAEGKLQVRRGGGTAGHNGIKDVVKALGSPDFYRVRLGVGRPPGRQDPADYVLSDFSAMERKELDFLVDRSADATEALIQRGLEWSQNTYHAA